MTNDMAPDRPSGKTVLLAVVAIASVAARFAASRGDLWLDEVWSLQMLQEVDSAWQIVLLNHDNNHILNSLVMYALGPQRPR